MRSDRAKFVAIRQTKVSANNRRPWPESLRPHPHRCSLPIRIIIFPTPSPYESPTPWCRRTHPSPPQRRTTSRVPDREWCVPGLARTARRDKQTDAASCSARLEIQAERRQRARGKFLPKPSARFPKSRRLPSVEKCCPTSAPVRDPRPYRAAKGKTTQSETNSRERNNSSPR